MAKNHSIKKVVTKIKRSTQVINCEMTKEYHVLLLLFITIIEFENKS